MVAMRCVIRFSVASFLLTLRAHGQSIIDLSKTPWTVGNGDNVTSIPASFPSQSHLDLFAAGVISDPLYGQNDYEQLWVQRSNWTYQSGSIRVSGRNVTKTWLVFEGLDTFTYIEMCGKAVGNADNQFRQWYYDITDMLSSCDDPKISLNFGSASKIVLDIANSSAGDGNINYANSVGKEFSGKIYARKEQNDFGWDWSPSFSPAGPWKPASIVQLQDEQLYVRNAAIDIYRNGQLNNLSPDQSQPWVFNASIDFLGNLASATTMKLQLTDSSGKSVFEGPLGDVYSNNETVTGNTTIDASTVAPWWPNGHGDQPLYNATVTILSGSGNTLAAVTRRVGFRTVVLNLNPITDVQLSQGIAPGSNWHFEVNGHEIYAKGSNLVPPDVFWPRVNETKMRQLFEVVQGANMNMLRVWASGVYLPNFIYDIADEMGILLWSEFDFTDSEYPTNSSDLANYEAEAYQNIRRINHHPSLALWAGGNELEAVNLQYFSTGPLHEQYVLVFEELLIKCVYANTRSISYIPSSTYNGYTNLDFDSVRPQTPRYKNTSGPEYLYTNTDSYNDDASQAFMLGSYPIGRFANEFGFISMPSTESWLEITPEDSLTGLESDIVVHRNRHTQGTGDVSTISLAGIARMTTAVELWYPKIIKTDPIANFTAWTYATQVFQADYYRNEIAFYRRGSGMRERQLGSLYWQLEDLWVAPTWSSIEANGRQKVLYYAAKDMFQPLIIYPYANRSSDSPVQDLDVYVTSDSWSEVSGTASFEWIDWSGNPVSVQSSSNASNSSAFDVPFTVGAINTTRVLSYPDISALFDPQTNTSLSDVLLRMTATSGSTTHTSYFHPLSLASSNLQDPGLTLSHATVDGQIVFTVTATKAVAAWVWMEYKTSQVQGYFGDNGFWLNKGESREVLFRVWNDWTGSGAWVDGVVVRSLWDIETA